MTDRINPEFLLYMRLATVHRIYATVLAQVAKGGWTAKEIADRLKRPRMQIVGWLESPRGWTLDRVSDLCLARRSGAWRL